MHFRILPILSLILLALLSLANACLVFYGGYTQEDRTPFGTMYGSLIDNGIFVCKINVEVTPIRPMWLECIDGYTASVDQPIHPKISYSHDNQNFTLVVNATPIANRDFWKYWGTAYGCAYD